MGVPKMRRCNPRFGNKLGLPPRMSTLIAAGTSICGGPGPPGDVTRPKRFPSEKAAVSAQKLGRLPPFIAVFPQECMGQLASSGPT